VGTRAPGRINTLFQPFKKVFFKNLDQNVPKMRIFLKEAVQIDAASGALPPNPFGLRRLGAKHIFGAGYPSYTIV